MSNELEIKIKDLIPAPELKDSAEYPISQEGVTYKVNHAQIEGKIVNKLGDRFVHMDQKGAANGVAPLDANKKIPNENLNFGEVKEGDEMVISGDSVYKGIKGYSEILKSYTPKDVYDRSSFLDGYAFSSDGTLKATLQPSSVRGNYALSNWVPIKEDCDYEILTNDNSDLSKLVVAFTSKESNGVRVSEPLNEKTKSIYITKDNLVGYKYLLFYINFVAQNINIDNQAVIVNRYDVDGGDVDFKIRIGNKSLKESEIIEHRTQQIKDIFKKPEYTDKECKDRFVVEMNKKAKEIGMINTNFDEPAGYPTTSTQLMSAEDAMRMVIYASDFRPINNVWNKKNRNVQIYGANSRVVPINTTVANPVLEQDCYILGGKTGSIGSGQTQQTSTLVMILQSKHTQELYAVGELNTALNNNKNKFENVAKVINKIEGRIQDAGIEKGGISVTKLPKFKTSLYSGYPFVLDYEYMVKSKFKPASITKTMSAILLGQFESNLNLRIEIKQSDITEGTGPLFNTGDIITLEDLLYCMMLPSSNTATHAVARYVGNILLKSDNDVI